MLRGVIVCVCVCDKERERIGGRGCQIILREREGWGLGIARGIKGCVYVRERE